jgi:RHS repeat-associated protein
MIGRTNKETGETWAYIYDARNCMTEVQKNGATVAHYVYDPEGNRIKALYPQEDGSPEGGTNDGIYYHYDYTGLLTENPIVEEPVSGPMRNFIFLNRKLFARVDGDIGSGEKYWYMTDHLGSAHGLMDRDGTMVWWADYEAFGKAKGVGGPEGGAVDEVPRFTGKAWDEKVGLYYFNARWYDPDLARFLSEDPAKDGLNWCIYAFNNPLKFIDPTGLANLLAIIGLPGEAGDNFEIAADTWVGENSTSSDTVVIINAEDYDNMGDLMAAIENAFGDAGIDQMSYFGHSYSGGLSVFFGNYDIDNRWIDSNTDWSGVTFNLGSEIYLFGCNGASGGQSSIAQTLANQTGATAYGYTSYTFFTDDKSLGHFERRPTDTDVNRIVPRSNQLWLVPTNGKPMTQFIPMQ